MASTPSKHGQYWRTRWRLRDGTWQIFRHQDKHHVERFLTWLATVDERDVTSDDDRYLLGGGDEETLTSLARALVADRVTNIQKPIKGGSVSGYEDRIKRFGALGLMPYTSITKDDVQRHVHQMRTEARRGTGRPYAANTIRETVSLMKQVGVWARRTGRADADPFQDVDLPKGPQKKEDRYLTQAVYLRLRSYAPSEVMADMMDLMATATGARIGEVLGLRVNDLGERDGYATLRVDETLTGRYTYDTPKNGEPRTIDIDPDTAAMLRRHAGNRPGEAPMFPSFAGRGPISYNSFSSAWDRMIKYALIDGMTFPQGIPSTHWLRHSYAAWFLSARDEQGNYVGNIYDLQHRLGHSSIQTTIDKYGHLDPQARDRAYRATVAVKLSASADAAKGNTVVPLVRTIAR